MNCSSNNNNEIDETPSNTEENLYFPPTNSDTWETKTLAEASWNESQLQPLLDYLEEKKNTRSMARFGLITLANGKWEDQQIISKSYTNQATNTS